MHARHFFVADKIESKDARTTYCLTEKMLADLSTKPTQGTSYKQQRNVVMGLKEEDFEINKVWHGRILEKHDPQDDEEEDLDRM